jgi:dipeptidyl aminopeptidase/acylaminoacyl peptidase
MMLKIGRRELFNLFTVCGIGAVLAVGAAASAESGGLTFEQLAAVRSVASVDVSPDGSAVAYTLNVPRRLGDDPDGSAWRELRVVSVPDGVDRVFVGGQVKVSGARFTPDGTRITYLAKRGDDEHTTLWSIPVGGGESRQLIAFGTAISDYRVSPDGTRVAFVADQPSCEKRKDAEEKGYSQEVFEEDWLPKQVWVAPVPAPATVIPDPSKPAEEPEEPKALELEGSVFNVRWSPDSTLLAVDVAPRPLIDDRYMLRKVTVVDAATGEVRARFANPGKLGDFQFRPDGATIAMISAADPNDPAAGRLMVAPAAGGTLEDVMPDIEAHISRFAWRNSDTLIFVVAEGVETRLGEVDLGGQRVRTHLVSGNELAGLRVPIMGGLSLSLDGMRAAFTGSTPSHPSEAYAFNLGEPAGLRLTDSNPWLSEVALEPQEVFRWRARDGVELEGLLIRPAAAAARGPLPLIMAVHGGPEGHRSNGWLTRYSAPGQLAASQGYAVFFPNYRGSTGRGVAFSKMGQHDAAGKEFDDLIDALDALVDRGIVDGDRAGVTGGSYGGYATAWLATRYTEHFRAGVMFVGISNKLSKGMTTEIPLEDVMVHSQYQPFTNLQFSLERSPIFWVEKGRTPLLIAGGTADKRVHPSQSLQLYRALKLIGKTPVRYVRYPGEGHGNRRAAARDDYARRLMRWMDYFVKEKSTDLPPWALDLGDDNGEDGETGAEERESE